MNTLRATGFVLENNILSILDQQLLPREERWVECSTVNDLVSCIQTLKVRGAPAIGIVAALFLGLLCESEISSEEFLLVSKQLRDSRPTAVNLGNYLDRLNSIAELSAPNWRPQIQTAAHHIFLEDVKLCEEIASHGVPLLRQNARILTHCNTGSIATAGRGTALGILTKAHEEGKEIHVWVDETRPLLQGARLTAWELQRAGIPHTILCDNMAGFLMQQGKVDCVIVGADRIAQNGDFANKIGTYSLAVLAKFHNIPFYVAAPSTTIDSQCLNGAGIPIEQRSTNEVHGFSGALGELIWSPESSPAYNPAFDVTPHPLVTGWILDTGLVTSWPQP